MIPPLAQIVEIPTSVTLVSGKDARNHLNRMLTLDISKDSFLSRKESLICDLNGRITSHQLHADLGEQILLFHHESISENLRTNLTSGIPWNEEIQISSGDGAIRRMLIFGKNPEKLLEDFGISCTELTSQLWMEFDDSMIAIIHNGADFRIYELLVPTKNYGEINQALESIGAISGEVDSGIAIKSMAGIIDLAVGIDGKIPFDLGLESRIDLKKGCYPGQEIHARMESRGAINKTASSFSSNVQLPLGKVKTRENHQMEVISSNLLGEKWISILIHRKEIDIQSDILLKSTEDEILIKSV
jgi:folate-binding protein YgfZ|tara:strand:- start:2575 stop:3480 length:906 start_codon:yes stop_codon:yes gene_type:complete